MFFASVLKLKSISLKNWVRTRSADLEFPNSGLVVVIGRNHTSASKFDSVASGKTALGEAICRPLLGATGRFNDLGDYSFDERGDTLVTVRAQLGDHELIVENGYQHATFTGKGEGLRFSLASERVERPQVRLTRAELAARVGITPDVAPWTVFLDGLQLKFSKLSQAEALELLMQAMNQPPWSAYQKRAATLSTAATSRLDEARRAVTQATADLASDEDALARMREAAASAQQTFDDETAGHASRRAEMVDAEAAALAQLEAAVTQRDDLKRAVEVAQQADAAEFGRLELELTRLDGERVTADRYAADWGRVVARHESDLRHATNHHAAMVKNEVCPTCRRPTDKTKPSEADVTAARAKVTKLTEELTAAQGSHDECVECARALAADVREIREKQRALRSARVAALSLDFERADTGVTRLDRAWRSAGDRLRQLREPDRSELAVALERHHAAQRAVAQRREVVQRATEHAAECQRSAVIGAYWARGFSPAGIPNTVLRQTIAPLNDAARLISETMTGGALRVQFAATAELADGSSRPRLTTRVDNEFGARKLGGSSKGEGGLINLIIAETQAHVGRVMHRVGFRWLDEVVTSQDPVVVRNVYAYFKRQAHEKGILTFTVDHHPDVLAFADHVLVAEKAADGFTTYHWE